MAYDEDLANRLREIVGAERGLSEQKMFGGLAFLIDGNMAVAVSGRGGLLLRCDPEGVETKRQLERWASRGVAYARSLPPKG